MVRFQTLITAITTATSITAAANYSLLTHRRLAFKSTSTTTTAITIRRIQMFIATTSIRTKTSTSTTSTTHNKTIQTTYSLLTCDSHLQIYINNNSNHNHIRTLSNVCKLT